MINVLYMMEGNTQVGYIP